MFLVIALPAVDGGWSDWSDWDDCLCDNDTDIATQQRQRSCTDPEPQNGGVPCGGDETDTRVCNNVSCSNQGILLYVH